MARKAKSNKFKENKTSFFKEDKYLEFDIVENIKRLTKQQYGDEAFYYLALYSFIEGYFRKKLPHIYDFDSSLISLPTMFEDSIELFSSETDPEITTGRDAN